VRKIQLTKLRNNNYALLHKVVNKGCRSYYPSCASKDDSIPPEA